MTPELRTWSGQYIPVGDYRLRPGFQGDSGR